LHLSGSRVNVNQGRKLQTMQMIILPFIPIVALITQNVLSVRSVLKSQYDVEAIDLQVTVSAEIAKLISSLQWERSEVAFFIFLNGSTVR